MKHRLSPGLAVAGLLCAAALPLRAQHAHLNAGAEGWNPGDRLIFHNGSIFDESTGYVREMTLAAEGRFAGHYQGNISFTALPTTVANGGPVEGAPAPGSFIMAGIEAVQGPAGGQFAFWEDGSTGPSLVFDVGYEGSDPALRWNLSDPALDAGSPGADPFGHLHGRSFTATLPGEYLVSFRLFDASENGAGGGPIHDPSELLTIRFAAIPEPSVAALAFCGALVLGMRTRRAPARAR